MSPFEVQDSIHNFVFNKIKNVGKKGKKFIQGTGYFEKGTGRMYGDSLEDQQALRDIREQENNRFFK